jgi:excisionase family DNA binding protein
MGEAARQNDVSRRTLERWVRHGQLQSIPSPDDARCRLVDPEAVRALVATMPRRSGKRVPFGAVDELASQPHQGQTQEELATSLPYQSVIDAMILHVYTRHQQLYAPLHADARFELTLEELRGGPLGRDLRRLADYALGRVHESTSLVLSAIDSVLQCLFWPPAAADFAVPREFWDTDLGKMLNRAKLRAYRHTDLISVTQAAKLLGITGTTVYRWMDDRALGWVRDDANGRTWIVRRDVEILNRVASDLAAGKISIEQALAS